MKKRKEKLKKEKAKKKTEVKRVPLETSDAMAIGRHDLHADHVVFVVSPHYSNFCGIDKERKVQDALRNTMKNCLLECTKLGSQTVTLSSIGGGVAGYDKSNAAKWIIITI